MEASFSSNVDISANSSGSDDSEGSGEDSGSSILNEGETDPRTGWMVSNGDIESIVSNVELTVGSVTMDSSEVRSRSFSVLGSDRITVSLQIPDGLIVSSDKLFSMFGSSEKNRISRFPIGCGGR